MTVALTNKANRLAELEQRIECGFVEMGMALAEIQKDKLYLPKNGGKYRSFDEYCVERWGWKRRHAYEIIAGAEAAENVRNCAHIAPVSEGQARPLTRLKKPEQQREAWGKTVERSEAEEKPITAARVEEAVQEVEAVNEYPFMRERNWRDYEILEGRHHLDALPEEERPRAVALVDQDYIPAMYANQMLSYLRRHKADQRAEIYRLNESDDPMERSLAITTAAEKPPMPDERIYDLREVLKRLSGIRKKSQESVKRLVSQAEAPLRQLLKQLEG